MRLSNLLPWVFAIAVLGTANAQSRKTPCSHDQATQADAAVETLKTWNSVDGFYKRYLACDDGSIAEGVSDAIAKLLANQWSTFNELANFASKDKGFEKFVVRHVDETIDWSHDAPLIHENALHRCPPGSTRLCDMLVARTTPTNK